MPIRGSQASRLRYCAVSAAILPYISLASGSLSFPSYNQSIQFYRSRMLHLRHNLRAVQEQLFEWLSTSPGTPLSGCSPTGHLSLRELTLCVLPLQRHITTVLGPSADELPPDLSRLMIGIYDCREQDSYRGFTAQLSVDYSAEEQVLVDSILE